MYMTIHADNIDQEHICCAFSDKKCAEGYQRKKDWLKHEFANGYVFKRLDKRAKVFIEYGPAEHAWAPITAPGYLFIGCFWVSGKYKKQGHGKALLNEAINAAKHLKKHGLVTVAGIKKFHFMSDTRWLLRQGFEVVEALPNGFGLFTLRLKTNASPVHFNDCARVERLQNTRGCVVFYSNRCPFVEYHVNTSLVSSCKKRGIPLEIVKLKTLKEAQSSPTPATIFSLYINGRFVTTDVSVCMDNRFDRILA
ncbi:GNAT family N-acetyltransferase [Desulfovibrio inopinatus]|uniref:GNAT family N-acetyltransferase n=1 Tax=Desulfovibrio inopinatus TaxID=102109 RepID=UPI00042283BB|nr:GNAT family N-acetyltransferase [Desulfovibrio inopinatus]